MKNLIERCTVDYHQCLIESLRNPEEAKAYLAVALEEFLQDGDMEFFCLLYEILRKLNIFLIAKN